MLQHAATHCNTLQHAATHCNTLQQHAATTRCNNTLQQHAATTREKNMREICARETYERHVGKKKICPTRTFARTVTSVVIDSSLNDWLLSSLNDYTHTHYSSKTNRLQLKSSLIMSTAFFWNSFEKCPKLEFRKSLVRGKLVPHPGTKTVHISLESSKLLHNIH